MLGPLDFEELKKYLSKIIFFKKIVLGKYFYSLIWVADNFTFNKIQDESG